MEIKIDGRKYKVEGIKNNGYPEHVFAYSKNMREWSESPNVNLKVKIQKKLNGIALRNYRKNYR